MNGASLYSILLELQVLREASLPATMGHQVHAMFLQLVARIDPELSVRLHDEPGYRPFTLSPLLGGMTQGTRIRLEPGRPYHIRLTLLDGGKLWDCLSTLLLETGPLEVLLGTAPLKITRLLTTAAADDSGWAGRTSWGELVAFSARQTITLTFTSPTAFNMNGDYFALAPEPILVWESLLRSWNRYAPAALAIPKQPLQEILRQDIVVTASRLATQTLHYPKSPQKGFTGTCTYQIAADSSYQAQLTSLAAFARFAGVGYKTTMGMGQVRMEHKQAKQYQTFVREAEVG